jgi:hypothetical protein
LFKYQQNLKDLYLNAKDVKLRVQPFEGLTSLSQLVLLSMDLNQMEEGFFRSLKIKKLEYTGIKSQYIFPIESLNAQPTKRTEGIEITICKINQHRTNHLPSAEISSNFSHSFRSWKKK